MKLFTALLVLLSSVAFAEGRDAKPADSKTGPAKWERGGNKEERAEMREEFARKAHMMALVGIAEALELSEADALKLSEKLKVFEEKRRPVREEMEGAMKGLKAAAEGDAAAAPQVDQNVQRVLDGRAQLAALDKDMFTTLSVGQTPQKKAKLALFMARFGKEMQRPGGGGGFHGRGGPGPGGE